MILSFLFGKDFFSSIFLLWVSAVLDLTVGMVPLVTFFALHPGHAIYIAIVSIAEVHLRAVVTLLVLFVACVAVFTEADQLVRDRMLHLGEFCLLVGNDRRLRIT